LSTKADILLSLHLLAAVLWIGGNLYFHIILGRAKAAGDVEKMGYLGQEQDWIGNRFFIGSAVVLLVTGPLLVDELGYDYEFWIVFALAVLLASFATGALYLGPAGKKLGEMMQAEGFSDATQAQFNKLLTVARIETTLLVLVVIDMAVKPGLG
jgi:uncharacterized membrane protein